ncbi:MAG TPA: DUF4394 domain-containing protein [Tepidisphaeraceae bacterium]|jgi:hypothetical protein
MTKREGLPVELLEGRTLLSAVVGLLADNQVVVFDSAAPEVILARRTVAMPRGQTLVAVDFAPRTFKFYGITDADQVYQIDLETGSAVLAADSVVPAGSGDRLSLEISPRFMDPSFRAVGASGRQFAGTLTAPAEVSAVGYAPGDASAGTNPDLVSIALASEAGPGLGAETAYAIDAQTDALVTIGTVGGARRSPDTGRLYTVGRLGLDAGSNTGFDVVSLSDGGKVAYASFQGRRGSTVFSTVDLTGGAATAVGTVGDGSVRVQDIAVFPESPYTALGVTAGNQVLVFDPEFPSVILGRTAVTGLRSDEALLSMDVRPGRGELFGVSSRDALYAIDLASGAARQVGARFTPFFKGSPVAADFDPVSGELTVLSDRGEKLRMDPASGAVIDARPFVRGVQIDEPLRYASGDANAGQSAQVVTLAHANNFAGAPGSTLYGLETTGGNLVRFSGSGSGDLTTVGPLGLGITDIGSIDIVSTATGDVAFAAVRTNDRPVRIYQIDLNTGAHTLGNGIASGSKPVRDIAIVTP